MIGTSASTKSGRGSNHSIVGLVAIDKASLVRAQVRSLRVSGHAAINGARLPTFGNPDPDGNTVRRY